MKTEKKVGHQSSLLRSKLKGGKLKFSEKDSVLTEGGIDCLFI